MIPQYEPIFNRDHLSTDLFNYSKEDSWLTEFKKTAEFEERIKRTVNSQNAICVNNGTISLSLALLAEGVVAGDKVLVPALSMIATANAVRLIGATPIFVDIDESNLCLDLKKAEKEIQYNKDMYTDLSAVIYVSLNGRSHSHKELNSFYEFCKERNIAFIEDAAQSFGSERSGVRIGNSEWLTSFSFSPAKIITTGQGGCLTTNDNIKALSIKRYKNFGREKGGGDIHHYFGVNAKFTDLQAVVGLEQIEHIKEKLKIKKKVFEIYKEELSAVSNYCNMIDVDKCVTPWFVDIYIDRVEELANYLEFRGVKTRRVYPPMTSQLIYKQDGISMPIAEKYSNRGLWLPSSLSITHDQITFICNQIKEFLERKSV